MFWRTYDSITQLFTLPDQLPKGKPEVRNLFDFIQVQALDHERSRAADIIGKKNLNYQYGAHDLLAQILVIVDVLQRYVLAILRPWILSLCHYFFSRKFRRKLHVQPFNTHHRRGR